MKICIEQSIIFVYERRHRGNRPTPFRIFWFIGFVLTMYMIFININLINKYYNLKL